MDSMNKCADNLLTICAGVSAVIEGVVLSHAHHKLKDLSLCIIRRIVLIKKVPVTKFNALHLTSPPSGNSALATQAAVHASRRSQVLPCCD